MKSVARLVFVVLLIAVVAACAQPTPVPTATPVPPTRTPVPPPTPIPPTPTPVPPTPVPVTMAGTFKEPNAGFEMGYPDKWTAVASVAGVGITVLSEDWQGVLISTLRHEAGLTQAGDLATMKADLIAGKAFSNLQFTDGTKTKVFGKEWDSYDWKGYYDAVKMDYTGRDTVVPYGKNLLRITTYAPVDKWSYYQPFFTKMLDSIVAPAADFAYVPPAPVTDWVTHTSSEFNLSVSQPADWIAVGPPWEGKGLWLNTADYMVSTIVWVQDGTDAAAELKKWSETLQAGTGVFNTVTLDEPKTTKVLGVDSPSQTGKGKNAFGTDVNFLATFVPHADKMLYILQYASSDRWEGAQSTLAGILSSLTAWKAYTSAEYGLKLIYPANWLDPLAPWEGKGLWLNTADYLTSLIVWVQDGTDAAAELTKWEETLKSGKGLFTGVELQDGAPIKILGEERVTKLGKGKNAFGSDVEFGASFVPFEGKMLYILWYAGAGDPVKIGQNVWPTILASINKS